MAFTSNAAKLCLVLSRAIARLASTHQLHLFVFALRIYVHLFVYFMEMKMKPALVIGKFQTHKIPQVDWVRDASISSDGCPKYDIICNG